MPSSTHSRLRAGARALPILVVFASLLLGIASPARAETGQDYASQAGSRLLGRTVPALKLHALDGRVIDLGALRGRKAVYLKFWATWCVPCREQMPHFERVQRGAGDDLQVIAVNIGFDDTPAQIEAYRRQHGLSMPILRDDDGKLGELFGLRVTPQHVIVGKDGRVRYVGHLADAALDAALAQARSAPVSLEAGADAGLSADTPRLGIGDAVPTIRATTLEHLPIALSDPQRRRPTVLAFLSPWCESYFAQTRPASSRRCRALREQLVALGRDRSLRWLGVASGLWASEADLREYRDQHRIPVPLTLDADGALFRSFGIQRVPVLVVLDANGRVLRRVEVDERSGRGLDAFLGDDASAGAGR